MKKKDAELQDSYRFMEGDRRTAVLETDGKLSLIDAHGSLENFASWKDYVKAELGDTPTTGDESAIVEQLSMVLGTAHIINREVSDKPAPKRAEKKEETDMATTKKAAKPAKEAKAPREKKEKVMNDCLCGCGGTSAGNFVPGHDARVHGWGKKILRGEMKFSEIPAAAAKHLKEHGVKIDGKVVLVTQGVKAKEEPKEKKAEKKAS